LGDFDIRLNWAKKRYVNPITGEEPCDPEKAKRHKDKQATAYYQPDLNGFMPDQYKDDDPF
jgi:hypothetical protein